MLLALPLVALLFGVVFAFEAGGDAAQFNGGISSDLIRELVDVARSEPLARVPQPDAAHGQALLGQTRVETGEPRVRTAQGTTSVPRRPRPPARPSSEDPFRTARLPTQPAEPRYAR